MAKEVSKNDLAARKARKAQKEMLAYMEENNLDPKKDWTGHKKHGKKIQAWIDIINLGNKKARELNEVLEFVAILSSPCVNKHFY